MHGMNTAIRPYRALLLAALLALVLAACGQGGTGGGATSAPASGGATAAPATGGATSAPAAAEATAAPAGGEATAAPASGAKGSIKVGSKDFTEEFIVAEMYAQLLEANGFTVEKKLNLGGTPVAQAALEKGDIDLYPEYTSTGLQTVLKNTERFTDAQKIFDTVKQGYEQQFKITWLQPSPFNDTNTFVTTGDIASKYSLKTFSDLAAKAGELRLG